MQMAAHVVRQGGGRHGRHRRRPSAALSHAPNIRSPLFLSGSARPPDPVSRPVCSSAVTSRGRQCGRSVKAVSWRTLPAPLPPPLPPRWARLPQQPSWHAGCWRRALSACSCPPPSAAATAAGRDWPSAIREARAEAAAVGHADTKRWLGWLGGAAAGTMQASACTVAAASASAGPQVTCCCDWRWRQPPPSTAPSRRSRRPAGARAPRPAAPPTASAAAPASC